MGCGGSKIIQTDVMIQQCIDMLNQRPSTQKFRKNRHNADIIEQVYNSQIFGGSIFLPVGNSNKRSARRDKENLLEKEIRDSNVDYLYGGGYYVLKNVKVGHDEETQGNQQHQGEEFMDIYILVETIQNMDEIKKLKVLNEQNRVGKGERYEASGVQLDDILSALNGYGRIVLYRVFGGNPNDPDQCEIEAIQEGRFRQGAMEGYCRNFDAVEDGFVELGYFREGEAQGKYQSFRVDGTAVQEGVKDGQQMTKEIEIANYQTRVLNPVNESTRVYEKTTKRPTKKSGLTTGQKVGIGAGGATGTGAIVAGCILL